MSCLENAVKVAILAVGLGPAWLRRVCARNRWSRSAACHSRHIMKSYAHYGFTDFTVALGYRERYPKRFMLDLYDVDGSLQIDYGRRNVSRNGYDHSLRDGIDDWRVDLVDTGPMQTGGRVKRLGPYLESSTFMLTYGDGLANIDFRELLAFHREHGRLATVTAVRPSARFGMLSPTCRNPSDQLPREASA